jgi:hypothetical protein
MEFPFTTGAARFRPPYFCGFFGAGGTAADFFGSGRMPFIRR